jgi:hypothetical protein
MYATTPSLQSCLVTVGRPAGRSSKVTAPGMPSAGNLIAGFVFTPRRRRSSIQLPGFWI